MTPSLGNLALYGLVLVLPLAILLQQRLATTDPESAPEPASDPEPIRPKENKEKGDNTGATIMQSERTDLAPPKDDPFTQEELRAFDGQDPAKPVYVAIKGTSKPTLSPLPTPPLFPISPRHSIPCSEVRLYPGRYRVRRVAETRHLRAWWILRALCRQRCIARVRIVEPQARGCSAGLEHTRGEGP